ncbi:glycosyltransferase family 2 protein [Methylococcus sp. EFPC2]|uniref:glycosyltransferase family 2 protein n=1 Tax=Methylococcus sp. EFPC2 TaxID=2812648 RepID=UPI0019673ED2|nr:glycosyltransferase family 2 protein [Methylococcus sp. EFPC2]QSA98859.1 glycosyltransferase family 2 protein [Methylococcus sp. EFPC2]
MTNDFRPCAVVPVYNHEGPLPGIVARLREKALPVILVDDASAASCARLMDELATADAGVDLIRHPRNRGKGGAVKSGLIAASARGYSHAVQVDADGQHDLDDLERMLDLARAHPNAVVAGQPIFDESVPKGRYYARYLTHVWVWINTLSLTIRDALCGYRVYPLAASVRLIENARLGERMDFDVEILIRLYWQGTPIVTLPTRVRYPQDGVSHFRPWLDNALLSLMQARMFFGMLLRLPSLIARHFR